MAEQANRIAEALDALDSRPLGARIELGSALGLDEVAADLAAQALGLQIDVTAGAPHVTLPDAPSRPVRASKTLDPTNAAAGGVWIEGPDDQGPGFLTADALVAVADPVADALPTLPCEPIVMVAGDRADPTIRATFAWAAREGAVLVLEPDLEALPESAAWARPHVIVAPAAVLPAARSVLRAQPPRWRRLLAVLPAMSSIRGTVSSRDMALTRDMVSTAEGDAWRELGVVVAMPVADAVWRFARRSAPAPAPS